VKQQEYSIDINESYAVFRFSAGFEKIFLDNYNSKYSDIVIVCIGTDRSTGDSLGPLVGHKLKVSPYREMKVFGTLEDPVHAQNLNDIINQIFNQYKNLIL